MMHDATYAHIVRHCRQHCHNIAGNIATTLPATLPQHCHNIATTLPATLPQHCRQHCHNIAGNIATTLLQHCHNIAGNIATTFAPFYLKIAYYVKHVDIELRKVIYSEWGMLIHWKFVFNRWMISECNFSMVINDTLCSKMSISGEFV